MKKRVDFISSEEKLYADFKKELDKMKSDIEKSELDRDVVLSQIDQFEDEFR